MPLPESKPDRTTSAGVKKQIMVHLVKHTAEEFRASITSQLDGVDADDQDVVVGLLNLHRDPQPPITNRESLLKWVQGASPTEINNVILHVNRPQQKTAEWRFEHPASEDKDTLIKAVQSGQSKKVAAVARVLDDLIDGPVEAHCVRCHRIYNVSEGLAPCIIMHTEPSDWERVTTGYEEQQGQLPCCDRWVHEDDQDWQNEPCNAEEVLGHVTDRSEIEDSNDPAVIAAAEACYVCPDVDD